MTSPTSEPADPIGVYLDTCVVIDIGDALNGDWAPNRPPSEGDRRLLAAARLFLYSHPDRNGWTLATSSEAKNEGVRGPGREWLEVHLPEVDLMTGGPPDSTVHELTERYEAAGLDPADARHAAQCASRPDFRYFVTSDKTILTRAPSVRLDHELIFLNPADAEQLLDLAPGEPASIAPADSHPLARGPHWWIPTEDEDHA